DEKLHLQFTTDTKTGVKLCGILGRSQGLEKTYYELLDREPLETENGTKIFVFHTAITELKPHSLRHVQSPQLSFLPKNFTYYAGGHVHYRFNKHIDDYGQIVYPGPIFPNSFSEIEELSHGSFAMCTISDSKVQCDIEQIPIKTHVLLHIDCTHKTPEDVQDVILTQDQDVQDAIVTIRLSGKLQHGDVTHIDFQQVYEYFMQKGAYVILKNTAGLIQKTYTEHTRIETNEEIEQDIVTENLNQIELPNLPEKETIINLLQGLHIQKQEGETVTDFEKRIITVAEEIFDIHER
ncbi:MAG: hypothetical protein ACMXYA_03335, partial [Candidatus Woesearchaeota archaeon]